MSNYLFICSKNKLRSPTAEYVAYSLGVNADSAGLLPESNQVLSREQVEWADTIFVMEHKHKSKLKQKFGKYLQNKKIVTLGIPDNYDYMQPELVELLEKQLPPFLDIPKVKYQKNKP